MVNCFVCNSRYAYRRINGVNPDDNIIQRRLELARDHRENMLNNLRDPNNDDRLCVNCDRRIVTCIADENDPSAIKLKVLVQRSTRMCFVCQEVCGSRASLKARTNFYVKTDIFIPLGSRCCERHLTEVGYLQLRYMENHNSIQRGVRLSGREIAEWFGALREATILSQNNKYSHEENFSDDDFKALTSLTKEHFNIVYRACAPVELYGNRRSPTKKDAIAFFLTLRQGLSDDFLKAEMNYSSRQAVSTAISVIRTSLMVTFVPENLGVQSLEARNREAFVRNHITDFANRLYNGNPEERVAILYPDCTYLKAPKSSHFRVARQSYSMHKKYTLLKAGLITAPDGFILDVHGPYFSDVRNNDAAIIMHDMNRAIDRDRGNIRDWLQENDIFVVDRGYRDALGFLEGLGINYEMPAMLPRGQRQFTTYEANQTRKVTATRWIVESRNGHIKSIFKLFRDMIPMQHCVNLGDFLRIACAVINRFHPPILRENADDNLARAMLEIAQRPNELQEHVENERLHLRQGNGRWIPMDQNQLDGFPLLPLPYLYDKTFGTYQVRLAPAYIQDRTQRDVANEFVIETQQFEDGMIRAKIFSRFTQALKHTIYISYTVEQQVPEGPQPEPIQGTYCTCKAGARTLGVCAHVASVLWYLGYARHQDHVKYPSDCLLRTVLDSANRDEHGVVI